MAVCKLARISEAWPSKQPTIPIWAFDFPLHDAYRAGERSALAQRRVGSNRGRSPAFAELSWLERNRIIGRVLAQSGPAIPGAFYTAKPAFSSPVAPVQWPERAGF
jgi:hypothetical protein